MTDNYYAITKNICNDSSCYKCLKKSDHTSKEFVTKILGEKILLTKTDDGYKGEYKNGRDGDIVHEYFIEMEFNENIRNISPGELINEVNINHLCPLIGVTHKINKKGTDINDFMFIKKSLFMSIKIDAFCQPTDYSCSLTLNKNEDNIKSISCRRVSIISSELLCVYERIRETHQNMCE